MRRPRVVLAVWGTAITILAVIGIGVEGRLHRTDLVVNGSRSAAASSLERRHFGPGENLVILLEGPPRAVEVQGRRLAARLTRLPRTTVVGPWSPGTPRQFRPGPGKVTLVVRVAGQFEDVAKHELPPLRRTLRTTLRPPVHGYLSGYANIATGTYNGS